MLSQAVWPSFGCESHKSHGAHALTKTPSEQACKSWAGEYPGPALYPNLQLADAGHGARQQDEEHAGRRGRGRLAPLQRAGRQVRGDQRG